MQPHWSPAIYSPALEYSNLLLDSQSSTRIGTSMKCLLYELGVIKAVIHVADTRVYLGNSATWHPFFHCIRDIQREIDKQGVKCTLNTQYYRRCLKYNIFYSFAVSFTPCLLKKARNPCKLITA